jgi:hypothetical protein
MLSLGLALAGLALWGSRLFEASVGARSAGTSQRSLAAPAGSASHEADVPVPAPASSVDIASKAVSGAPELKPASPPLDRLTAAYAHLDGLFACELARTQRPASERLADWAKLLPDTALLDAQREYADAVEWAMQNCEADFSMGPGDDWQRILQRAGFLPGDPLPDLLALETSPTGSSTDPVAVRAALERLLTSALAAPNPTNFQAILENPATRRNLHTLGPFIGPDDEFRSLWLLAACDLGADCGPQSAIVRTTCLESLLCGYPTLEAALLDARIPVGSVENFQQRRRELVTALRENGVAGIFEVHRPGGG